MSICVTVLTGRRLPLLRRTISALSNCDTSFWTSNHIIVYLNGHDPDTRAYCESLSFIDRFEHRDTQEPEPIGDAVSRLVTWIPKGFRYHLHLEDDWECQASDLQFLLDAMTILETEEAVGQVRLRLASENVLSHHMVTNAEAPWTDRTAADLTYRVAALHFTFNPSLVRTRDLPKFLPASNEIIAATNYLNHFPLIAQLEPGVFKHIGNGSLSLRVQIETKSGRHSAQNNGKPPLNTSKTLPLA